MRVSYRVSLIVAIPMLVLATGGVIATRTFVASRDTVRGLADDLFREVAQKTVERTQSHLARAIPAIELAGLLAKDGTLAAPGRDPDLVGRQLLPILRANPGFSWVTYSERDGSFAGVYPTADGKLRLNASRVVDGKTARDDSELAPDGSWRRIGRADDTKYDPRARPFWKLAEAAKRRVWTEPYVFFRSGGPRDHLRGAGARRGGGGARGAVAVRGGARAVVARAGVRLHPRRQADRAPDGARGATGGGPHANAAANAEANAEANAAAKPKELTLVVAGERWMARVQPFSIDNNTQAARWLVAAVAPEGDFLGGVRKTTLAAIAISAIALGGALVLALRCQERLEAMRARADGRWMRGGDAHRIGDGRGGGRQHRNARADELHRDRRRCCASRRRARRARGLPGA
jgi:hypothetical protein